MEKVDAGELSQYVSFCSNKPCSCKAYLGWFLPVLMPSAKMAYNWEWKQNSLPKGIQVYSLWSWWWGGGWGFVQRTGQLDNEPQVFTSKSKRTEGNDTLNLKPQWRFFLLLLLFKTFHTLYFIMFFPLPQLPPDPFHLPCLNAWFSFSLFQRETRQNQKKKSKIKQMNEQK